MAVTVGEVIVGAPIAAVGALGEGECGSQLIRAASDEDSLNRGLAVPVLGEEARIPLADRVRL